MILQGLYECARPGSILIRNRRSVIDLGPVMCDNFAADL
jgi:hypothetical protein